MGIRPYGAHGAFFLTRHLRHYVTRFWELGCRLAPLARASVLKHSEMRMKKGVKKAAEMRGLSLGFLPHITWSIFWRRNMPYDYSLRMEPTLQH